MPFNKQVQSQHLLWRAGFGPSPYIDTANSTPEKVFQSLLEASKQTPSLLTVVDSQLVKSQMAEDGMKMSDAAKQDEAAKARRQAIAKQMREGIKDLNIAWMDTMVAGKDSLREKVALFWHGHFACRNNNVVFQQNLLNTIRTHALGNFRDLLLAVSKSPAMLAFLNNQQNRKSKPNENFARELMELFTLGTGGFTEADVKAAARAFTGWGFNQQGEFVFRNFIHDDGPKTFLGRQGKFGGEDILNIILEKKETATFITRKVYRYFVNEHADEQKVMWLANRFYKNNYDLSSLFTDVFTSDWFYEKQNIGTKIKSPVELLVGIRRMLAAPQANSQVQLLLQRSLGQLLLYPPNVAGWPGGKNWIDSSSLMLRLRVPQLITGNELINISPKDDDDVEMGMGAESKKAVARFGLPRRTAMQPLIDWTEYTAQYDAIKRPDLFAAVEQRLLQTPAGKLDANMLHQHVDSTDRQRYIQTLTIALMSTPEYQLC